MGNALATLGCLFVRLKWPVMLIFGVYYLWHRDYLLAGLTAVSPLVAMLMVILSAGMVGVVQKRFIKRLMFESDIQALAKAEGKAAAESIGQR